MISSIDTFRKKLLFRSSHRGTKEMDILLGNFFKKYGNSLNDEELIQFQTILEFTDKTLSEWLIMNKNFDAIDKIAISKKIREFVNRSADV